VIYAPLWANTPTISEARRDEAKRLSQRKIVFVLQVIISCYQIVNGTQNKPYIKQKKGRKEDKMLFNPKVPSQVFIMSKFSSGLVCPQTLNSFEIWKERVFHLLALKIWPRSWFS